MTGKNPLVEVVQDHSGFSTHSVLSPSLSLLLDDFLSAAQTRFSRYCPSSGLWPVPGPPSHCVAPHANPTPLGALSRPRSCTSVTSVGPHSVPPVFPPRHPYLSSSVYTPVPTPMNHSHTLLRLGTPVSFSFPEFFVGTPNTTIFRDNVLPENILKDKNGA